VNIRESKEVEKLDCRMMEVEMEEEEEVEVVKKDEDEKVNV
jgi:hypothetical protein